jgi:glycosyltransferase involved in cell wall biosynthesis
MDRRVRVLFVTWDGPGLHYLEGLFVPIFAALKPHGINFDVLQFRWGSAQAAAECQSICEAAGVGYRWVAIRRRPRAFGALATAVSGARAVRKCVAEFGSDIVMPRSLLPAFIVRLAGGPRLRPILFDADGLEADERVEFAGLSPSSVTYRVLRGVEARAVRDAAAVLARSTFAREVLVKRAGDGTSAEKIFVTPNGRDPDVYRPAPEQDRRLLRAELGIAADAPVVAHLGSVGGKYRLDKTAALATAVTELRPDARLLVLAGVPAQAKRLLAAADPALAARAIIMNVPAAEVPRFLSTADLGACCIHATFSMRAVAPIKLAEYLQCGVPVVGTAEVGDTAPLLAAGVFRGDDDIPAAAAWFIDEVLPDRERFRTLAREAGIANFAIARSIETYRRAIRSIPLRERDVDDPRA